MSGHSTSRSLRRSIFRRPDEGRKRLAVEPLEDRRMLAVAAVDDFPGGVVAEAAAAPAGFDFGDAPSPYPTTLADDGARHEAIGPTLGSLRDEELDGQPTAGGDGADEDGVTFGSIRVGQLDAMVTVNVQNAPTGAKLDAWIDFNGDGNWGGPGEQIFASQSVNNGDTALRFDVPSWAISGSTYARFRLSTAGDLPVGALATDGEVEDYEVTIIPPASATGLFVDQHTISTAVNETETVFAADLDGDGDIDVLSASSRLDGTIAWYENDGSGHFTVQTVGIIPNGAESVFAADLDGDGDIDVLTASTWSIVWHENDGRGSFTDRYIGSASYVQDVFAADIDGDGDMDVLSASSHDDRIAWYENDGSQNFSAHNVNTIKSGTDRGDAIGPLSVYAVDVDSDGDMDVLSASSGDDKIAWYENDGNQGFTAREISADADGAQSVFAADLDGDGDIDVLSASSRDDKIAWYENDGNQGFTTREISTDADGASSVFAVDVDGDGDIDVLSASLLDNKIAWYENDGSGGFSTHTISIAADGASSVFAADVDGDGDIDVLSASRLDDRIAWYENLAGVDFGDAPAPFPTLRSSAGAFHAPRGPTLGASRDSEPDGQPTSAADGDGADEDGVVFGPLTVGGGSATVNVQNAPEGAVLDAWIDFDGDGAWTEPSDHIVDGLMVGNGTHTIPFIVPLSALVGTTYARFRLRTAGDLAPTGSAADGEVEDYQVRILPFAPVETGDAPAPYPTRLSAGGAFHQAVGPTLGSLRDAEDDGRPSAAADGDGEDEDGVTFSSIRVGLIGTTITVNIQNAPTGARLDAWIDFDGDGVWGGPKGIWGGPGEQIFDDVPVNNGDNALLFGVPNSATIGDTYARFRLSTAGGLTVGGSAADGEVEDYRVVVLPFERPAEFGDAPAPYPTRFSDGGAVHVAGGPTLGSLRDVEDDGQPSTAADRDGGDDGVTFGSIRVGQLDASVIVSVHNAPAGAKLDAWVDFNGDGSWGGPGEQIFDSLSVVNGDNALQFDVPSWAPRGKTYARFRLSTLGDLAVGGSAADGEVEDYEVTIIPPAPAPGVFGGPNIIATVSAPMSVFAADLDGDGDVDVLSASHNESKIAWYENDGSGGFTAHTISTDAQHARSVFAVDVDGDGDIDVLSASLLDDKIAWYENDGNEGFTAHTISTDADQATSVFAADVDGDGDIDVLSASNVDNKIAWYENDGNEGFTAHTISTTARFAYSVFAADVDGDGDIDVLSASSGDNKIAWYENDGREGFTSHTISTAARGAKSVFAADVDGDGDIDVLSASGGDNKIAWYENDGSEGFTAHTISTAARGARSVFAADMDGDGDTDILSASWYENDGSESFMADTVSVAPDFTNSVVAADVDGDGDLDVVRAGSNMIAWYENVGFDYGDAPAPYPTLSSDDGPFHVAIGPIIGASRDAEIDGQPTDRADGDGSGEDGVKFGPMIVGRVDARVTVDVRNAPAGALLDAWIDFDGDGNWSSLTDHVVEGHIVHDGINTILFGVPQTAQVGTTFARFRLRTTGDLSPTGPADDGEVEDYLINVLSAQPRDFGDAPAPYPTRLSDQGAFHEAVGPTLGAVRDVENDGQPSAAADGDGADDDAVTFFAIRVGQLGAAVTVNVRNAPAGARVDAWIDFNRDGTWGGPGEQIFDDVSVDNGDNALLFDVPSWAVDGSTFARVRLSTAGDLGIGGYAADGEVEDYLITINPPVAARGLFVGQNVISTSANRALSVFAVDLDGDGDMDVLSASESDDRIAWYENDGSERFTAHDVNTPAPKFSFFEDGNADNARSVFAADLDGDGDIDVLSASHHDDRIAWYENDGSQNFTQHNVNTPDPDYMFNDIDGNADGANSVFAADVDGDGDIDVLSASVKDDRIAWYENDGSGHFVAHTISTAADGAASVFAADVDGDGDIDVLSASFLDDKIAWYENDGLGGFIAHTISTTADWANSVFAADVDRDGDMDVLSASSADDKIAWYENDGSQNFTEHVVNSPDPDAIPNNSINGDANVPRSVFAADLDGDGDIDVLSASSDDDKIAWYENDGSQNFTQHDVNTPDPDASPGRGRNNGDANAARSVFVADVDGDGRLDVLSASMDDDKIAWYQNFAGVDFGDAPAPYLTSLADAGAAHGPVGPRLGATRDAEVDGQPSLAADGDGADEDGVVFGGMRVGQIAAVVIVDVQNAPAGAMLDAWIDFNGDGDWTGPNEQIASSKAVINGDNPLRFNLPITASVGATFARFRLSTAGGLGPDGSALDGEVEDYLVNIEPALPSTVGGLAWRDVDGDGVRSAAELGLADVAVQLLDGDLVEIASTMTDADGSYRFSNMPPGPYTIEFTRPEGFEFVPRGRGGDLRLDSDANRVTGRTSLLLGSGQDNTTLDAGLYDGSFPGDVISSLRITEVRFESPKFVELKNIGVEAIDIAGVRFIDGIDFDFRLGNLTTLFPGGYLVIVEDSSAFSAAYDTQEISVAGEFQGVLDGEGERLELVAPGNETIQEFFYDPTWFAITSVRDRFALTVRDETSDASHWGDRSAWRPSSRRLGSPGADDPRLTPDPGAVVINEFMTNPVDEYGDRWIELYNTSGDDIDIGGWYLGQTVSDEGVSTWLPGYRIEPGTMLAPGEYVVFTRFYIGVRAEAIHLTAGDEHGELLGYSESASFGDSALGVTFGRINESSVFSDSFSIESVDVPKRYNILATISSELVVSDLGTTLVDIDVTLDTSYKSNATVSLSSPSGTEIVLLGRRPAGRLPSTVLDDESDLDISDVFNGDFDRAFRPHEPLSAFDGEDPNGIWTLTLLNFGDEDTGWINSWSVNITVEEVVTTSDVTALTHPTMGTANASAIIGPVIIGEILYRPAFAGDEFVELYNTATQPVDVGGWEFEGIRYVLPAETVIPGGGVLLVVPIRAAEFRAKYGLADDVLVVGPYRGQLNDGGESLELFRIEDRYDRILVDRVDYDNVFPWPPRAGEGGGSLQRLGPTRYGNHPGNWTAALPTPGDAVFVDAPINTDLTGNGFVDFEDLTVLLANWNQNVPATKGNLVNPAGTPVNFEDLTVLLAAWTGPGPAASPQPVATEAIVQQDTVTTENRTATSARFDHLGGPAHTPSRHSPLRRLQAAAVDRAMAEDLESTLVRRKPAFVRRRR